MIVSQVTVNPRGNALGFDCANSRIYHFVDLDIDIEGQFYNWMKHYQKRFGLSDKETLITVIRMGCEYGEQLAKYDEDQEREEPGC